jgi:5-methylcytosine-specific restriction enzyme A
MARIKTLAPLVPKSDGRTVKVEPKKPDPFYHSDQHKQWREQVLGNAGFRCEWIENGSRCTKDASQHRLFADHIKELRDGGAPFDPANGQCLCGAHHTRKTALARAARMISRPRRVGGLIP